MSHCVELLEVLRLGGLSFATAAFADEARGAEAENPAERQEFLTAALAHYADAQDLAPESLFAMIGTARVHTLYAQGVDPEAFDEADRAWRRVLAADPKDWEPRYSYGVMLNSWANARDGDAALRRRAADELERAIRLKGDDPPDDLVETARRVRDAAGG